MFKGKEKILKVGLQLLELQRRERMNLNFLLSIFFYFYSTAFDIQNDLFHKSFIFFLPRETLLYCSLQENVDQR